MFQYRDWKWAGVSFVSHRSQISSFILKRWSRINSTPKTTNFVPYFLYLILIFCLVNDFFSLTFQIYKLETKPKGKVLIINITKFEDHGIPSRDEQAHNISATSITALFKKLNFKVETKSNITAQVINFKMKIKSNLIASRWFFKNNKVNKKHPLHRW